MSDYHIATKSENNRYANVFVHLSVPNTQTVAGQALSDVTLTYRRALKEKLEQDDINEGGSGTITSKVYGIEGAELAQLQSGELVECEMNFRFSSPDLTNAQRKNEVQNGNDNTIGVIQMKLDILNQDSDLYKELIEPLAWWGYHTDMA